MIKFYIISIIFCLFHFPVFAQGGVAKGKITDENGQPVAYVSVTLSGTNKGTQTGEQGNYQLSGIPAGPAKLVFTAIGYVKQVKSITINNDRPVTLNVKLTLSPSSLNEVVITGVSRKTELRRNPVPVTVLTQAAMEQNVNNNLIDAISKGVPGVASVSTGPNVSKPFIRGLGYNRVLTLYDGLRQEGQQWGDEHGIEIDQYGIARAEVVKGPASLTYGSDALAGVINFIPSAPDYQEKKLTGKLISDYHINNGMIGVSLNLGYKINDWTFSARGTEKTAYDYSNKIDGRVFGTGFRELNLAGFIRTDKKWGYSKFGGTLYSNLQEIPDGSRDSLTRKFTKQILDDGDDIKNRPVINDEELTSYSINPLHQHVQHYRLYSANEFNLGGNYLNVTAGVQRSIRQEYNHPTLPEQPGLFVVLNTFNYDIKYGLHPVNGYEITFGINGMLQENKNKDATDFPIPDYNLTDAGGFFFTKKTFGKLDLSGGVRYDIRSLKWNDFYVGINPASGFEQHVEASYSDATLQFPSFSHQYKGISGSAGLTYNFSERILLKANIARGYRAPNITEVGANGLDPGAHIVYLGNRNFKPEFNLQQDLGLLIYLKDADISLELFNNHIQNYIYQARLTNADGSPLIIVPGNLTYQYQQSKARLYGAEITLNIHPVQLKWLSFDNSLAWVNGLNKNKAMLDQYGNDAKYLPSIPPLHLRSEIRATREHKIGFIHKPYAKLEADNYLAQNHFYAVDNTETYTPAYTLVNCGLGGTVKNRKEQSLFDFSLQAENLFNVAYQSNLNRLKYFEYYSFSPNGHYGIYNMGRNISFKIIVPIQ